MKHKPTDVSKLSDSELDDLILYGIQQQENYPRHSNDYQHHLNTVAAAKEEKARRGGHGADSGRKLADVAKGIKDTRVEDASAPNQLHTAPDGDPKEVGKVHGDVLPGVIPKQAQTTPENAPHGDYTEGSEHPESGTTNQNGKDAATNT